LPATSSDTTEVDHGARACDGLHRRAVRLEHAAGGERLDEHAPHRQHVLALEEAGQVEVTVLLEAPLQRSGVVDGVLARGQLPERFRPELERMTEDGDAGRRWRGHRTSLTAASPRPARPVSRRGRHRRAWARLRSAVS
jgi:hypothetical protein